MSIRSLPGHCRSLVFLGGERGNGETGTSAQSRAQPRETGRNVQEKCRSICTAGGERGSGEAQGSGYLNAGDADRGVVLPAVCLTEMVRVAFAGPFPVSADCLERAWGHPLNVVRHAAGETPNARRK